MLRLIIAWAVVNGLLMGPAWLAERVADGPHAGWISLEAALLVGVLALLPRRPWSVALSALAALGVLLLAIVGLADLVFQVSLARSLNLFVDLKLLRAVYDLAVGNIGLPLTLVAIVGIVLILALLILGLTKLLVPSDLQGGPPLPRLAPRLAGVALVVLVALGLTHKTTPPVQTRLATPAYHLMRDQGSQLLLTWREHGAFRAELANRRATYAGLPGLLAKLRGQDVMLTFIESYGMAAIEDKQFAAVVRPRLDTFAAHMAARGVTLASGKLTSSTQGGMSWLAHGTMISGLWLSSNPRYELLMASDRETLVDDFRHARHRTVAVMPAIARDWPEGKRLRYDRVFTASDIPYEGPPMYWVTMPDQYTWSFLQHDVREQRAGRPLFVETAMVSSHAPWVPVLPLVPWESIGHGAAFEPFRQEGHPPEELWVDTDQLRANYARSLDYSLAAMASWAETYLDDHTLLVVLGDHQAAPWVTGSASAAVPVHVMARDPALVQPFLAWGFRPGAIPAPDQPERRMDQFRDWFVRAYSDPNADAPPARPGAPAPDSAAADDGASTNNPTEVHP